MSLLQTAPRYLLYALFLLMPIFLVPGLSLPLDLNKQMLLAVVVFGAGILWVIDILRSGEISFRWHILFVPLGLFVLFALISALGSGAFSHSFFGANAEPDSFFNILLFALLFVLIVNNLTKPEYARNAGMAFVAGAVLSSLVLFASSLFSFTFPFGSPFAFAIYAGGAFLMTLVMTLIYADYGGFMLIKYLRYLVCAILFLALLFISQWIAWAGIAAGSLLIIYFLVKYQHKSAGISINQRWILPLITFILSVLFLFVSNPLGNVLKSAPEVRLGREASIGIAKSTVFSNVKNALFGSGPATFRNQYALHRSADVNKSPFWNLSFSAGSGAITSLFATLGILGGGAIVLFWLLFLWFSARFLAALKHTKQYAGKTRKFQRSSAYSSAFFSGSILLGGAYFIIAWLLYETNFLLLFAGILLVALWAASGGEVWKIQFKKSSLAMFWGMTGSVVALVALVFGLYTLSRNYSAEIYYWRGAKYADSKDYASAIGELQKAARIVEFDKYFRKLSQVIFFKTSEVFKSKDISSEVKNAEVQRGISAAEAAAVLATQVNPKNSVNFEQLGDFYTNTIPVSDSAATMPFPAYNKAAELNPQSPYIPLKKARAHLANAKRFAAKDTERAREAYSKALIEARKEAEKALALKGDFKDALEFLKQIETLIDADSS